MGQYAFSHEWEKERERLRHFEAFLDPGTIRHLEAIGVAPEWRCLEVGGGAGSITAWLCEGSGQMDTLRQPISKRPFLISCRTRIFRFLDMTS